MSKAGKGSVVIQSLRGRLRLVWSCHGERYFLSLNLNDSAANRSIAELKARTIERDIALEVFDRSLEKYRPHASRSALTVVGLFQKFTEYKAGKVDSKTVEKYQAMLVRVKEFFADAVVSSVFDRDAEQFKQWLLSRQKPVTVQDRLSLMRSAWRWGMKQGLVNSNPWEGVRLKVPPQQRPKPFTLTEIQAIVQCFRSDRYYAHYADFVEFLFGTGCRTGEAIGLQWKHVADDCSSCWIGEIVSRGNRKPVKGYQPRTIPLTDRLQSMLMERRSRSADGEDLVFPGPKGSAIDDNNFRKRIWKKILEKAGVLYRKPYISRSTLISHALNQGMNPVNIAELTGHDVDTLYRNYAGAIGRSQLPDILTPPSSHASGFD